MGKSRGDCLMELLKSTSCRNGITGIPYDMGIVEDKGSRYLIIQFDIDHTAAINISNGFVNIDNHLRGDYFSDTFKQLLEAEALKLG